MKKIYAVLCILALSIAFSCSGDDSPQVTTFTDADIAGEWFLVELNSTPAIDLENDGTMDTNLMWQTTCFDGWSLEFIPNGNVLNATSADIIFDPTASPTLDCTPRVDSGNYSISGNDLTVSTTVDGTVESQTLTINISNDTLSFVATESDVASMFNIPDGEVYSNLTSLEFVLQKVD